MARRIGFIMNMRQSVNNAGAIPVAAHPVILSAITLTAHPVILSAIPVAAHPVILSAIPVYRDVVEERGGMAMPPVLNTRHYTAPGGDCVSPHISTSLRYAPLRSI